MEYKSSKVVAILRLLIVASAVFIQIGLYFFASAMLHDHAFFAYCAMQIFAIVMALNIMYQPDDTSYRMLWIIVVLILPVTGVLAYLTWGKMRFVRGGGRAGKMPVGPDRLRQNPQTFSDFYQSHPDRRRLVKFLNIYGFPLYSDTDSLYFPLGDELFDAMIADMEKAERFIFLEYFIVSQGSVWDRLYEVLSRKAGQGVDVRLMYDDFGSLITLPGGFKKRLEQCGIKVCAFNPVHRYISELSLNHRNHQKIAIIDGDIGYTGGINISDEYSNLVVRHGHWKDTAVRISGRGVWSMTATFIHLWNYSNPDRALLPSEKYMPSSSPDTVSEGFFQFFADGPSDSGDRLAVTTYKQIISAVKDYVYITTPYLILDSGMLDALITAAKSGADVRILTPHIPDHWYVHTVTRSYYGILLKADARIFEYKPGFMHAKMLVSDDDVAIIGTVNMDFRSFYLNYECGMLTIGSRLVGDIKSDIEKTTGMCVEICYDDWIKRPWYTKLIEFFLNVLAPMF